VFISVLLVSLLLGVPGQQEWVFGAELPPLALMLGGGLFSLNRRASTRPDTEPISA